MQDEMSVNSFILGIGGGQSHKGIGDHSNEPCQLRLTRHVHA